MSSLLPELTPLATCALSLGLAYVKLDRFGFRDSVRDRAKQQLANFQDSKESLEKLKERKLLKELQWLAKFPQSQPSVRPSELPPWAYIYDILYASGIDRRTSWAGIGFAFAILVLGRLHAIDLLFFNDFMVENSVSYWSVILLSGFIALLIGFAWIGDLAKSNALKMIDSNASEISGFINDLVMGSTLAGGNSGNSRQDEQSGL